MSIRKLIDVIDQIVGVVGEAMAGVIGKTPKPKPIPVRTQPEIRKPL